MWEQLLQGGAGALAIGVGVKYLWPILKNSLEAAASRGSIDTTLLAEFHALLEKHAKTQAEMLAEQARTSIALQTAQLEIERLTQEVKRLTAELASARGTTL